MAGMSGPVRIQEQNRTEHIAANPIESVRGRARTPEPVVTGLPPRAARRAGVAFSRAVAPGRTRVPCRGLRYAQVHKCAQSAAAAQRRAGRPGASHRREGRNIRPSLHAPHHGRPARAKVPPSSRRAMPCYVVRPGRTFRDSEHAAMALRAVRSPPGASAPPAPHAVLAQASELRRALRA
jgi:hypothetical protein